MRRPGVRVLVAGLAASVAACGYPEFGFVPDHDSSAIEDAPVDSTVDETRADSTVDTTARDADADADAAAIDSTTVADASDAESAIDSIVDTRPTDTLVAADTADAADSAPPCNPLIDDFEDGNEQVGLRCGRSGLWFTFNDGTTGGVQTPDPSVACLPSTATGRAGSTFAAHTSGSGFTSWGGGIGFHFVSSTRSYDTRPFTGIGFWARVGSTSKTTMRMDFPDSETDPGGGLCGSTAQPCFDHFGAMLTFDTTWRYYVVKFADLKQGGWGWVRPSFDSGHVFGIQVQVGGSASFDLWLDDIAFVP
jgi:hypothetical protein